MRSISLKLYKKLQEQSREKEEAQEFFYDKKTMKPTDKANEAKEILSREDLIITIDEIREKENNVFSIKEIGEKMKAQQIEKGEIFVKENNRW